MRVLYFGTYRENYTRNRIMIDRLRAQGVEVTECHAPLWRGDEDREQAARGGWIKPAFLARFLRAYARLLLRYRKSGEYDILMLGYPGQIDIFLAWLLARLRRKPLVWDIFMSIALISLERGLERSSPITVRMIQRLERLAVRLPELLVVDTPEYARWYQDTYGVKASRIRLLPTGADDRIFRPRPSSGPPRKQFTCFYYGTFILNHGVQYIIEAARLLREDAQIHFLCVGRGPQKATIVKLAGEYNLPNVTFLDWVEQEELSERMASADIVLGSFGVTPQALITIQHKIYEAMAAGRPVITGDSPAVRAAFQHGEHLYLCERQSGPALAESIRILKGNPSLRQKLAENGQRRYHEAYDFEHTGKLLAGYLEDLLPPRNAGTFTRIDRNDSNSQ